ncbi:hypothetical protein KCU81_g641, partial [Aureobasidium melanogenum]
MGMSRRVNEQAKDLNTEGTAVLLQVAIGAATSRAWSRYRPRHKEELTTYSRVIYCYTLSYIQMTIGDADRIGLITNSNELVQAVRSRLELASAA